MQIKEIEKKLEKEFKYFEEVALKNQKKVLKALQEEHVSARHFSGTTGYGYDDIGRDTLARVFARVFNAESAIVSPNITCGSHAIAMVLFGLLRPNDEMISIAGKPYDTLDETIFGVDGEDRGSLKDLQVKYSQIDLVDDKLNFELIEQTLLKKQPKVVFLQRSRGYNWRNAISISDIEKCALITKKVSQNSIFVVDNCYGEFINTLEPTDVGANVIVGSLIKNPGGGLASTGAYIAGDKKYVDMISYRFTSPSLSTEVGSYEKGYREFYQGLFLAPHVVCCAVRGAYLIGEVMAQKGYEVTPKSNQIAGDIIKSIKFENKDEMIKFIQNIQKFSPIDADAIPMPWDMPGYLDPIIMAAGTFVSGASIELSADGPVKPPYVAYFQGALTYEHAKLVAKALNEEE